MKIYVNEQGANKALECIWHKQLKTERDRQVKYLAQVFTILLIS